MDKKKIKGQVAPVRPGPERMGKQLKRGTHLSHSNLPPQRLTELKQISSKLTGEEDFVILFSGANRTDKTMAAEVLATDLGRDLYRIDLSAVVSKYVGETEKNLRELFDAADKDGAILFFDEADALFGKRTEVKDSHDRYANTETSYLRQRLEKHRGMVIIATNRKQNIDEAFLRRLRFAVDFPKTG